MDRVVRQPLKILFICTANVCRSPLAEGYLRYLLGNRKEDRIEVGSAGIAALIGNAAFGCAVDVARQHQFDLSGHRARQLTKDIAHQADRILCMETWQAGKVLDLDRELMFKVALLGSYHPSRRPLLQIRDPRQFKVPETLQVFELIKASIENLLQNLSPP